MAQNGKLPSIGKSGLRLVRECSVGLADVPGFVPQWMVPFCESRRSSSSSSIRGNLKNGEADVAIIGGGIVGLATAREIVNRFSSAKVVVVEKEQDIVKHQTSHNRCDLTEFHSLAMPD